MFMGNGVRRGEGERGVTVDTLGRRNAHDVMCITWWLQIVDRALVAMAAESDCGLHGNATVPFKQHCSMGGKAENKGFVTVDSRWLRNAPRVSLPLGRCSNQAPPRVVAKQPRRFDVAARWLRNELPSSTRGILRAAWLCRRGRIVCTSRGGFWRVRRRWRYVVQAAPTVATDDAPLSS